MIAKPLAASPAKAALCDPEAPASFEGVKHSGWSAQAIIDQVNSRQFTPGGTIRAAPLTATLDAVPHAGEWRGAFRRDNGNSLTLAAWSSRIFTRRF